MSNDKRELSYTHQDMQISSPLTNLNNKKNENYISVLSYTKPNFDKLIHCSERNGIDVNVIIKNKEVIKTKSAKIIIERISINLYYIFIEMMNETFKYCSEINDKNYQNIKDENKLLVEFQDFTDYFLKLIQNCKNNNNKINILSCILEDDDNNNGSSELTRFIVEEKTEFRKSNLLVLKMKKVNPLFNGRFSDKSILLEDYKEKYNNLLKNYKELKSKYDYLKNNKNQNSSNFEEEKNKLIKYYENKLAQEKDILSAQIQLDNKNFILENKIKELENKVQILTNELNTIRTENETLHKQINELNQKKRNLSSNYDDLKSENESSQRKINEKTKKIEELNKKIENLNLQLEKKDDEIKNLEIKNSKLSSLISYAKTESNSANNIKQKYENDLKYSNSKVDKLIEYLKEKDLLISEKEDSINNYKSIIIQKDIEYESKVDEIKKLKKELELYKKINEEKDKSIKDSKKMISYLSTFRDKSNMKKEKSNYNVTDFKGDINSNIYRHNDNSCLKAGDLLRYKGYIGYNYEENPGLQQKKYGKPMTPKYSHNKYRK